MESAGQEAILRRFTRRRPHVKLQWDAAQSKVVAAPMQVGLSWTQACIDPARNADSRTRLVDSFDIPKELTELTDLNDVLNGETWDNCLSQSERDLLSIFLPDGVDPMSALQGLLGGEELHFGNPLQEWGEAVCAGAMHPDALMEREFQFRQQRKSYSKCLRIYHDNMITSLKKMKEIWDDCENPDEVLGQIQRSLRSGPNSRGGVVRYSLQPPSRNGERQRLWGMEVEEKGTATRAEGKKQKVKRSVEEGARRVEMRAGEEGTEMPMIKEREDASARTKEKGRKINFGEDGGGKRLKVKSGEERQNVPKMRAPEDGSRKLMSTPGDGSKSLKMISPEEKRLYSKPTEEGPKKAKIRLPKEGANRQEVKLFVEGSKTQQMKPTVSAPEKLKDHLSEKVTKKLKIKPAVEGSERLMITSSAGVPQRSQVKQERKERLLASPEDVGKRQQVKYSEDGSDTSARIPKSTAPRVKHGPDGAKFERTKEKTKKLHIRPFVEEEDISTPVQAKRSTKKSTGEGKNGPDVKPSKEGAKKLKIKLTGDGFKSLKQTPLEEEAQPKAKKRKVKPLQEGTKGVKAQTPAMSREEQMLANSAFEREWFEKYVQVTVGPVSNQKLAKACQEVKVSRKMFQNVKLRSEAGEEVHLDTLDSLEEETIDMPAAKNAANTQDTDPALISSFWQTVLLKDIAREHRSFMQRRDQHLKLAKSLARDCKSVLLQDMSQLLSLRQ